MRFLTAIMVALLVAAGAATGGSHPVKCHVKQFSKAVKFMSRAGYWRWEAHVLDAGGQFGKGVDDDDWASREAANEKAAACK